MNEKITKEYRCACGKLLFKGFLFIGNISIKCRHCREVAMFLGRLREENEMHLEKAH